MVGDYNGENWQSVGVSLGTGAATLQGLSESRVGLAWRGMAV